MSKLEHESQLEKETKEPSETTLRLRRIVEPVRMAVLSQTGGRVKDLVVSVIDEIIVIEGRVSTYYNKLIATQAAMEAADNEMIVNAIVVG